MGLEREEGAMNLHATHTHRPSVNWQKLNFDAHLSVIHCCIEIQKNNVSQNCLTHD